MVKDNLNNSGQRIDFSSQSPENKQNSCNRNTIIAYFKKHKDDFIEHKLKIDNILLKTIKSNVSAIERFFEFMKKKKINDVIQGYKEWVYAGNSTEYVSKGLHNFLNYLKKYDLIENKEYDKIYEATKKTKSKVSKVINVPEDEDIISLFKSVKEDNRFKPEEVVYLKILLESGLRQTHVIKFLKEIGENNKKEVRENCVLYEFSGRDGNKAHNCLAVTKQINEELLKYRKRILRFRTDNLSKKLRYMNLITANRIRKFNRTYLSLNKMSDQSNKFIGGRNYKDDIDMVHYVNNLKVAAQEYNQICLGFNKLEDNLVENKKESQKESYTILKKHLSDLNPDIDLDSEEARNLLRTIIRLNLQVEEDIRKANSYFGLDEDIFP